MPRCLHARGAFASHSFLRAAAVTAGQQSLTLVSEPLPLASVASRAPSLPPTALPLVVPHCRGGAEQKTRCSLCTCGVQWGRERSVHIGTTKDYNGRQWCKWVFTKILLFCYSRVAKCGYLVRVLYFSHRKNRLVAVIVYICARNVI